MSMQGLKNIKNLPALEEVKVTPELKVRLQRRIEHAEKHGLAPERQVPYRSWLRPAGYTAAAAAVLTLALYAGGQKAVPEQAAPQWTPVSLPPTYQQGSSSNAPVKVTVSSALVADAYVRGRLEDQIGNPLTNGTANITLYATDANGVQVPGAEAEPGRKIITNGEFGIRVTDARAAVDRLQREAVAAGGYVAEATLNKEANGSWIGRVVLRVPASQAAATVQSLGQIGAVERERQWTQDVTDQYMDLEHRITILKEHEERLRELADKAATFDDWNKLATQINSTRVEIENLTGRLKLLANQVDFAILNIQVVQPAPGEAPVSKAATSFGGQIGEAFSNSVARLGALGRQAVVGVAALAPFTLALVPVGAVVALVRRKKAKPPEGGARP